MIIKLPNQSVLVLSASTVSTAVARAIFETHYPDRPRATMPPGATEQPWLALCPRHRGSLDGLTVHGLLRTPLDAFAVACAKRGTTIADALALAGTPLDVLGEFCALKGTGVRWFRQEDQVGALCAAIGVPAPDVADDDVGDVQFDDEQLGAFNRAYGYLLDAYAATYEEPPEESPFSVSKLAIRRKLRELGLESLLDGFLAAESTRQKDWDDAMVLMSDDPLLASSIPAFAAATNLPESAVIDLLTSCHE